MSLMFRPARVEDADGIAAVRVSSWQTGFSGILPQDFLDSLCVEDTAETTRNWMSLPEPPGDDWLVEDGEAIVGWAHSFVPARGFEGDDTIAEISAIYALPSHWGLGVGHLMMDELMVHFGSLGVQRVILWVMEENVRARAFYERHGFAAAEGKRELRLVPDSGVWEVCYEVELKV